MALTVKETFEQYSELSPSDKDLPRRIIQFAQGFLNKNQDHTAFFGGNLIGTPAIRWTDRDTRSWLEDVLLVEDIKSCQEDLYECPGINKDFNVSSNIFNLSIPWVMNVLWRQDKNIKVYRPGMEHALIVGMAYHLSSFMVRRFKYPANPDIALSMFEKLNNKYDFKVHGSWIGLLRARTDIFMNTEGKYPDVWQEMTNDLRTVVMCNEVNGNIRNSVNILTEMYHKEKEANERINKASKLGTLEGEQVIKDYIRRSDKFKNDLIDACSEPSSLIKEDIFEVVLDISKNVDPEMLDNTLRYLADNIRSKDRWDETVGTLAVYLLELSRTKKVNFNSVGEVTNLVTSMFKASSTKNKDVLKIKKEVLELSKKANVGVRDNKHASNVGAIIRYLTIRALAINYYK